MEIIAYTLDITGKIMVAYTALAVHNRVRQEHKIDGAVFRTMNREKILGIAGIILMIMGYLLHVYTNL
jgi:hypothetical protein